MKEWLKKNYPIILFSLLIGFWLSMIVISDGFSSLYTTKAGVGCESPTGYCENPYYKCEYNPILASSEGIACGDNKMCEYKPEVCEQELLVSGEWIEDYRSFWHKNLIYAFVVGVLYLALTDYLRKRLK